MTKNTSYKEHIIQKIMSAHPIQGEDSLTEEHFELHISALNYEARATKQIFKEKFSKDFLIKT